MWVGIQGSGTGLEPCLFNTLPGDPWAASPQNTLWLARFRKQQKQQVKMLLRIMLIELASLSKSKTNASSIQNHFLRQKHGNNT